MPIRVRLTALCTIVAMVLVGGGALLFLRLLGDGLLSASQSTLRAAAAPLIQTVADTGPGRPDFPERSAVRTSTTVFTQVVDPRGRIADSSPDHGARPLLTGAGLAAARQRRVLTTRSYGRDTLQVLSTPVRRADGRWVVVVANSLAPRAQALERVGSELTIAGVLVILLVAGGSWAIAGAALRPVERMRRSVTNIHAHDPTGRVSEPATRDELAALARTLNDLLRRLQDALAGQRRLVADAGHELRSPLAVLRTELELADRPTRSRDDLADAVRHAINETDRLIRLADDLLLLARSDEGALVVNPTDQPLEPVLSSAVAARRRQADERHVGLDLAVAPDVHCPIDAERIRHAVDNLLDNALRNTPSGGVVTVRVAREHASVTITVADDGPGFPPHFLGHAFERFRRPDPARNKTTGGTGLGLAIVDTVVSAHGGTASAANLDPHGAFVQLRLPTARQGDRGPCAADST